MPSKSQAEQSLMAIAEHHPEKVFARNRGVLNMSHGQLHDFASTPRKHLPGHVALPQPSKKRGKVFQPYGK